MLCLIVYPSNDLIHDKLIKSSYYNMSLLYISNAKKKYFFMHQKFYEENLKKVINIWNKKKITPIPQGNVETGKDEKNYFFFHNL